MLKAFALALAGLALGGCVTTATVAPRHADAALLIPCETGAIPPAKPTSNEAGRGWIEATRLLLECKAKHDGLIAFDKAGPK